MHCKREVQEEWQTIQSYLMALFEISGYRQFELRLARIMCSHVHSKRELTDCCDLRH